MAQLLSICTIEGAEKGFAVTKFLIKIISLDPFDMTVANHAYFAAMLSYTRLSAISRNSGRCEVLDVFFCDANIWSFIGVYGICIWALKDMIRLLGYDESEEIEWFWLVMQVCVGLSLLYFLKGLSLSWPTDRSSITFRWDFFFLF